MLTNRFNLHFLLHSAALVEDELRQRLAGMDILPRQARTLDALARMEPASQVRLAQEFGVAPSSISTMTSRLIEAGLITREIDPSEARSNLLRLTEKGRSKLSDIHATWHEMDAFIAEKIGAKHAAALAKLTRDLRDCLGGHAPGRTPASLDPPSHPKRGETHDSEIAPER